jgi:ADP-heptose:LPS heptosyltransferase
MRAMPDAKWFSFQYPRPHSLPRALHDSSCKDVREMGQRLQSVDLLISVDTMAAHLAGALGLRVWTLLPYECDWRWMLDRHDSPWYPTMRLFRQQRADRWEEAVEEIGKALREGAR